VQRRIPPALDWSEIQEHLIYLSDDVGPSRSMLDERGLLAPGWVVVDPYGLPIRYCSPSRTMEPAKTLPGESFDLWSEDLGE
jgi:hypothetical protein